MIEGATDRLVFGPPLAPKSEARRLQKWHQAHRDNPDIFVHRDDVEPTNNGSERGLRDSVIRRKVTGGYRSAWGAEASAIFTTPLTTARSAATTCSTPAARSPEGHPCAPPAWPPEQLPRS